MDKESFKLSSFRESLKVGKRKNSHLFAVLGKNLESLGLLAQRSLAISGGGGVTRNSDKYRPTETIKTKGRGRSASSSSAVTPARTESANEAKAVIGRLGSSKTIANNGGSGPKRNGSANSGRNTGGRDNDHVTGGKESGRGGTTQSRPSSGSRAGSAVKGVKLKPRSGRIAQSAKEK